MTTGAHRFLAAALACALLAGCGAYNDQRYDDAKYLRRWKVTDASGKVLSEGCTQQADPYTRANVIDVHATPGSVITYEDNLGIEYVEKSRDKQPLPTSDAYWCGPQNTVMVNVFSKTGLDAVQVADTDPPATIKKIELVNPHTDSTLGTVADGIRLSLEVQHPGVLHLGFLDSVETDGGMDAGADAGADAGTKLYSIYPAMTLQ